MVGTGGVVYTGVWEVSGKYWAVSPGNVTDWEVVLDWNLEPVTWYSGGTEYVQVMCQNPGFKANA